MQQGFLQQQNGYYDDVPQNKSESQEQKTTLMEWLAIVGLIMLTYMVIIFIWIVCMAGIHNNFEATVICFMVIFFCIYIPGIGYFWYNGLQVRTQLIQDFINKKLQENQLEIGGRV
ncbi:unnamed protein product (macronuclear) [Paramecium tetraurelia]|uniref:Cardiolipin synthase N-terminal domain-containing protein n=1 Tax=Paramecium tetraurelia TaxID=5888 RepID=A0E9H6_PARTE|nr:uncharacterized protein GSPATT00024674001 [Paramecium tetraurelia]CAK91943.1 unnamed protein product [Paramecium tetraurelia]|eukprot:XP_001459340.1 hypothetical protein (macronuclear) [Paramecium tetraurelia strain d4-2]